MPRSARALVLTLALVAAVSPVSAATAVTDPVAVTAAPDDPLAEQTYDADDLLPPTAQTTGVAEQGPCCGSVFSGEAQVLIGRQDGDLPAAGVGDSATFAIDVPADGRYAVAADVTAARDYGIHTLAIDGAQLGDEHNAYSPTVTVDRRVPYGELDLTAGTHEVTLTVVGKDPAATGYLIGLDLLRLRKLPGDGRLALTPTDGAAVRGNVPIVGYSTAAGDTLELALDGTPVDDRAVLGGDSVTLLFENAGGNGLQSGFRNGIRVRGQDFLVADQVFGTDTAWTDIPGELLGPGTNVVTFFAGTRPGECNHDDFNITNVRLELPDGTIVTDPELTSQTIQMGDGVCGTNTSRLLEVDFTFEIPEPSAGTDYDPGRGFVWDTTTVADGEHTITLTAEGAGGPETITSTVIVDNTAPAIATTSPTDGASLKGDVPIDATVTDGDGTGVATTTVTLDGEPIDLPGTLSTDDLEDGQHTFVFTATDVAGNTGSRTVTVTTVRQRPDEPQLVAPADAATGVATDAELRVIAGDAAGDPLTVTFLEATASHPRVDAGASGATATSPPAVLDPPAQPISGDDTDAMARADDVYAETAPSDRFPFQRFDLALTAADADRSSVSVRWEGRIDPARAVTLFAWDVDAGAWAALAEGRGVADGDLQLRSPVDLDRFRDGDVVHLLVQGTDPFADDIDDPADHAFRDPATYDFSLAWMTDTQYLSEGAVADRLDAERFADAYRDINEWIVANADDRKIAYTAHTGDIINNWITIADESAGYEQRARREFQFASDTMQVLEDAGMPYGVTPGNHDNKFGTANQLYNEYFPPSRFDAAEDHASQEYYGGSWRPDDNQNHYDLFSAGGQDFLVLYLGFIAGQEEIDWANAVLREHADRKAIFATHEYLLPSGSPDGRGGPISDENDRSQGDEFFREVILPNDNVFLALSGHTHGVALNIRRDVGAQGRTVVEMLANYQFYELGGDRRTGFFRLLQFDLDRGEVSVNTYSPALDNHNANEFDTSDTRIYAPSADEFTVPVDVASRTTAFATDALRLEERLTAEIGSADIASGAEATVTWHDLEASAEHLWYARATDDAGSAAESDVFSFTTADDTPTDACADGYSSDRTVAFGTSRSDSGVPNHDRGDGCTILDLIWQDAPFAHHGDFLRQVRDVTTRFRDDGLLSQDEWRDVMRAATRSRTARR